MTELLFALILGLQQPDKPRIAPTEPQNVPVSILEEVWGSLSPQVEKLIMCESGGNLKAHNLQTDSRGLMQIHYPTWHKVFGDVDYYDYDTNVKVAKQIFDRSGNWSAWKSSKSCHKLK